MVIPIVCARVRSGLTEGFDLPLEHPGGLFGAGVQFQKVALRLLHVIRVDRVLNLHQRALSGQLRA